PDPEPTPDPTPAPAPVVPAALVDHARKLSAEHKRRTGYPIDADGLRTRLGVPAPLAVAIANQLT
ncbi:SpdA protein, partial [Streptomyces sp. OF3]|nr:SpdA protein [Streptomyces alkaliterrae]